MDKYMRESARTETNKTLHTELVPIQKVIDDLEGLHILAKAIDQDKKGLFYGRDYEELQFTRTVAPPKEGEYQGVDVATLHAILGIISEAHELGEVLLAHLRAPGQYGVESLGPKLIDESGDVLWYLAKLFRRLGTTFEEVGDKNTAKLLVRYPERQGFTEDLANHRDEAKENATAI